MKSFMISTLLVAAFLCTLIGIATIWFALPAYFPGSDAAYAASLFFFASFWIVLVIAPILGAIRIIRR